MCAVLYAFQRLIAEGGPTVWRVHADDGVRIPMVVFGCGPAGPATVSYTEPQR